MEEERDVSFRITRVEQLSMAFYAGEVNPKTQLVEIDTICCRDGRIVNITVTLENSDKDTYIKKRLLDQRQLVIDEERRRSGNIYVGSII